MGEAAGRIDEKACRALQARYGHPEVPRPFASGLAPIDREHAILIAQHRRCVDLSRQPERRALELEITRYRIVLDAHDRSEEALQRDLGYPELGEHALVHRQFVAKLDAVIEALRGGGAPEVAARWMAEDAPRWLGVHVRNDLAIARWCGERGITLARGDCDRLWRAGVPELDGLLGRALRLVR